ncbi:hypothetical protein GPECTOR_57g464 [Gonium pectorale]|uniref:Uncharacterized protein n=1 Tax=Gonium pectorale TaxID=33097 RepID=A0A150G5S7_GONPE|nr:hypothetical protein GPECTOR_57g464 [Gonium pectorale]|eukprot:KXZ45174.1 hypothetical protein GPECTOR_57g464 [Gonium pectorale]
MGRVVRLKSARGAAAAGTGPSSNSSSSSNTENPSGSADAAAEGPLTTADGGGAAAGELGKLGRAARAASTAPPMGRVVRLKDVRDAPAAAAPGGEGPPEGRAGGRGGRGRGRAYEWELAVSCFGPAAPPAERLISWTRVCPLPGGDLSPPDALLAAEQQLLRLRDATPAQPDSAAGAAATEKASTATEGNATAASASGQPPQEQHQQRSEPEPEHSKNRTGKRRRMQGQGEGGEAAASLVAAAQLLAAARAVSEVPVPADGFDAALRRASLDEVCRRAPSDAQRRRLERLARGSRMFGLDPAVFLAVCPGGLAAARRGPGDSPASSLPAGSSSGDDGPGLEGYALSELQTLAAGGAGERRQRGGGGGGGRSSSSSSVDEDSNGMAEYVAAAAASAAPPGLLLHHVMAVQQLVEAAENAYEAQVAAEAAAAGLPPPATRRQVAFVRSLMRRAARGVEADPGRWLRSLFRGAVPERRLRRLVEEMVQEEYGPTVREYDMARRQYGGVAGGGAGGSVTRRSQPRDPLEELLRALDRKGAKEVIDRLQEQVAKLPRGSA